MKKIILILFVLFAATSAFATAQFPDDLIYNGEELPVFSNPLESYFDRDHPRPNHLFAFSCTACWRGYVATWKIEQGSLFLIKVIEGTCSRDAKEIPLELIFPNREAPVRADWFSGVLRIPRGRQLHYVHMGYGSVYEKELLLTIEKGKLVREDVVDRTKSK